MQKCYLFFLGLFLFMPALFAEEFSLAGHWVGHINVNGQILNIDIDFTQQKDQTWQGDITIPQQNAKDLPLNTITITPEQISFKIANIPGDPTFQGKFSTTGDLLSGRFLQAGQTYTFELKRTLSPKEQAKEQLKEIDAIIDQALKDFAVPGLGLAVIADQEIIIAKGYGFREVEKQLPVTPQTLFAIGSTSKAFTAFVLASLIDEGKLSWDQSLFEIMPDFRLKDAYTTQHLTVRDILSHQSGLPRHDLMWYNSPTGRKELYQRLRYLEPVQELREGYRYQNLMFMTAGIIAERLTGKSWEDNVRERILTPLGMTRTNFSVEESQKDHDFAAPYRRKKQEKSLFSFLTGQKPAYEKIPFRDIANVGPAGSINSCPEDMARWVQMHLKKGVVGEKRLLEEQTLIEMHTPQVSLRAYPQKKETLLLSYGLAWIIDAYRGHYRVSHGGNIDGFSALVTFLPFENIGIVVLTNKNASGLPDLITCEIMDRLLKSESFPWLEDAKSKIEAANKMSEEGKEKKEATRVANTTPSHTLADYVGQYAHLGYGTVDIQLQNNQLHLTYNKIEVPLDHWHYDVFMGSENAPDPTFAQLQVQFQTDFKGNITELLIPLDAELAPTRFQRKPDARLTDPAHLQRFVGKYALSGALVSVSLKGNVLEVFLAGQPPYELIPEKGSTFQLKGLTGFSVCFIEEGEQIKEIQFHQPNGVFTAARIEQK